MLPYRESRFTKTILTAFFLIVLGYAYFEGRGLLYGPTISVESRVMEVDKPFITIEGTARRIASLSMNGHTIPVTEDGAFSEPYLLTPGYNKITLTASDRYNKSTERVIEIVYTPVQTSTSSPMAPQE